MCTGETAFKMAKLGDYGGLKQSLVVNDGIIHYKNPDAYMDSLLHAAVESGCEKVTSFILSNTVDVDYYNTRGQTALHYAVSRNHPNLVTLILRKNANPNISDKFGETALHKACFHNCEKGLLSLLACAVSPHQLDNGGWSAVTYAAEQGHKSILQLLTRAGASVNHQSPNGMTALHLVTLLRNSVAVNALLTNGASIDIIDNHGNTALDYADQSTREAYADHGLDIDKISRNSMTETLDVRVAQILEPTAPKENVQGYARRSRSNCEELMKNMNIR